MNFISQFFTDSNQVPMNKFIEFPNLIKSFNELQLNKKEPASVVLDPDLKKLITIYFNMNEIESIQKSFSETRVEDSLAALVHNERQINIVCEQKSVELFNNLYQFFTDYLEQER